MTTKKVKLEEDSFNLKNIVSRLLDQWKVFVISLIVFIALGIFYIWYVSPSFNVNAEVEITEGGSGNNATNFLPSNSLAGFGDILGTTSNVQNELEVIQSRDIIDSVVRKMNLNIKYSEVVDGIRTRELYTKTPFQLYLIPKTDSLLQTDCELRFKNYGKDDKFEFSMSNSQWDTSFTASFNDTIQTKLGRMYFTRTGKVFDDELYKMTINSVDFIVPVLIKNLTFEIGNGDASVIDMTYTTNVPKKGEDFLNGIINEYKTRDIREKNKISDSTLKFINQRIEIVDSELSLIEGRIQSFKQNNNLADIEEQSRLLVDNASEVNKQLNDVDVQISVANSTLAYIKDDKNNTRPVPYILVNDPTFQELVQRYNGLLAQKDKISLTLAENNPISQNLNTQISNARGDLTRSLQNQISALQTSRNKILSENSKISGFVQQVPVQERQYVSLQREQNVKQALYLYLLQKKEETAITEASTISAARVIETPKSDFLPYFPNAILLLAASIFLGIFFPSAYVILKYALHTRITSREDITEATDCNIIAEIGHNDKNAVLAMKDDSRSVIVEQFRALRTNMSFLLGQKKCPIILITSSMSSEGKSFVAANLGQVFAISDKKVVLIEMDFRKPHISKMFGLSGEKGLTNYLISGGKLQDFIQPIQGMKNVSLISSGPVPPNPAELMMLPAIKSMFEELKQTFDLIIIDSPPIGLVTDAQLLAEYSDVNFFILRERYSYKNSLEIVNDLLDNNKFSNLYLVINDVKKGASYRYGYGYGYGYGGYGYGYGNYHKNGTGKSKKGVFRKLFSRK